MYHLLAVFLAFIFSFSAQAQFEIKVDADGYEKTIEMLGNNLEPGHSEIYNELKSELKAIQPNDSRADFLSAYSSYLDQLQGLFHRMSPLFEGKPQAYYALAKRMYKFNGYKVLIDYSDKKINNYEQLRYYLSQVVEVTSELSGLLKRMRPEQVDIQINLKQLFNFYYSRTNIPFSLPRLDPAKKLNRCNIEYNNSTKILTFGNSCLEKPRNQKTKLNRAIIDYMDARVLQVKQLTLFISSYSLNGLPHAIEAKKSGYSDKVVNTYLKNHPLFGKKLVTNLEPVRETTFDIIDSGISFSNETRNLVCNSNESDIFIAEFCTDRANNVRYEDGDGNTMNRNNVDIPVLKFGLQYGVISYNFKKLIEDSPEDIDIFLPDVFDRCGTSIDYSDQSLGGYISSNNAGLFLTNPKYIDPNIINQLFFNPYYMESCE